MKVLSPFSYRNLGQLICSFGKTDLELIPN
jgi:hypothetical protein